jgi:hypothetical protein
LFIVKKDGMKITDWGYIDGFALEPVGKKLPTLYVVEPYNVQL